MVDLLKKSIKIHLYVVMDMIYLVLCIPNNFNKITHKIWSGRKQVGEMIRWNLEHDIIVDNYN